MASSEAYSIPWGRLRAGGPSDHFGASTALSAHGKTLALGAVNESSSADPADHSAAQSGAVSLY